MHRYLGINLGWDSNNTVEAVTQKAMSVYLEFVNNWLKNLVLKASCRLGDTDNDWPARPFKRRPGDSEMPSNWVVSQ
jgi:hypothetical protein